MSATDADHDDHAEPTTDHAGWTAELELRGHIRSQFPEADKGTRPYPAKPDPARAEYFDPDGTHAGYCDNDALRQIDGIEVYDDRIILPFDTCRRLEDDADSDGPDEFSTFIWRVMDKMRIMEDEHLGKTKWARGGFRQWDSGYSETHDPDETDPRPIYARLPRDHRKNALQQLYERRRRDGRTLLCIIIARDAATGTGKTTLACQLARDWDTHGWTADRATLDPGTYIEQYIDDDTPSQSVLLLDEAEQAADNRRSMSGQNVKLSHLWATMRFREIYSIITLPSASMLDKRLKELADLNIVVHNRGTAVAYKTKIDDHTGEYRAKRLCRLRWDPMDDDPEYQKLTDKKAKRMKNYAQTFAYGDDQDDDQPDPKEAKRDYRRQVIERMSAGGWTQQEIADALPDIGNRSTISKILNSQRPVPSVSQGNQTVRPGRPARSRRTPARTAPKLSDSLPHFSDSPTSCSTHHASCSTSAAAS